MNMKLLTIFAVIFMTIALSFSAFAGGNQGTTTTVQTATDLARALGGNATVNGNIVTLTRDVSVERNQTLVIPEGVTLNLTTIGPHFFLKDGAILTVNGTMNAYGGWGDTGHAGGLIIDGTTTINGNGTINLSSKGILLNISGNDRRLTLDGVTLVGLADNSKSLVSVDNGGEFILKSGAITGNSRVDSDWANGGGVSVWQATFIMEGGAITGNSAQGDRGSGGGGVGIGGEGSTFTMTGGTISGNTAGGGGGVRAEGRGINFTMSGGEISGNNAITSVGWGTGGGVDFHGEGSTFTMSGGTISGNTVDAGSANAVGGGVHVTGAIFVMSGGSISGNRAIGGRGSGNSARGGGVGIGGDGTTFRMSGGTISGNVAEGNNDGIGGGVLIGGNVTFMLEGGTIYGSASSLPAGTYVSLANSAPSGSAIFLEPWRVVNQIARWGTGGTYTRGGVSQTGGSNIATTNETLIAIPAR
jgi:hypothetical protein